MEPFEALSIRGPEETLQGFVAGWAAGRGWAPEELRRRILLTHDWRVRVEGRGEGIFGAMRGTQRPDLLVRSEDVAALLAGMEVHAGSLQLQSRRRVAAAHFEFDFEILSRQEAASVRTLFESPPDGVTVSEYQPEEKSDRDLVGIELRGSLHDYVFRGRGVATGDVRALLELHERTRQHERIHSRDVTLELAP